MKALTDFEGKMNSPPITSPTRRFSPMTFLVAMVSITAATFVWNLEPQPTWMSDLVNDRIRVIGYTSKGDIITQEVITDADRNHSRRLRVRDITNGHVIRDVERGYRSYRFVTPDGKWLFCSGANEFAGEAEFQLVSIETLQPRFPLIRGYIGPDSTISPDGSYMVICQEDYSKEQRNTANIVDLTSGTILFPTEDHSYQELYYASRGWPMWAFSPDSRQWATLIREGEQHSVLFRDLKTGAELGRCPLPTMPKQEILHLGRWIGDRLEVCSETCVSEDGDAYLRFLQETWSFQVQNYRMTGLRAEPLYASCDERYYWQAGTGWVAKITFEYESAVHHSFRNFWNSTAVRLLPRILPFMGGDRGDRMCQLVSPITENPVGRPLVFYDTSSARVEVSRDGQWLIETTSEDEDHNSMLRVWRFPARTPWAETLLVAAVPWLLILFRRSKAKPKTSPTSPAIKA